MTSNPFSVRLEKLLARWGGNYIWRVQLMIETAAFLAASIGIGFILLNVKFNSTQIVELIKAVFIAVAVVNAILVLVSRMLAPHARKRLDTWAKGIPLAQDENELPAWREIVAATWQYGFAAFILAIAIVVAPVALYMYLFAGANVSDAIHIFLGGLLSATGVVILNTLLLELALIPARLVLLPRDPSMQLSGLQARDIRTRLQVYVVSLTTVTVLMLGPRSYQAAIDAMTAAGLTANVGGLQFQIVVIAILAVIIGMALTSLLARTMELPIQSIVQTLLDIQKGNLKSRAKVLGLDEVGQVSVYLNQTLDQLEFLQTNLEKQVVDRTRQLQRNTIQLRTATSIARQNIGSKNLGELLDDIVRLTAEQLELYFVGIFLLREDRGYALLQSAFPERGKFLIENGYGLKVEKNNILGAVVNDKRPMVLDQYLHSATLNTPGFSEAKSETALPLIVQQTVIGVLDLQSSEPNAFSKEDLETLQVVADQIALSIENNRLLDESKAMISQLEFLASQQTLITWQEHLKQTTPAFQFSPTGVKQIDPTNKPVRNNDLRIPLVLRGQEIGSIALQRKDLPQWDRSERELAEKVAAQIALALENSRLLEETRQRASQEQTVNGISARLNKSLDIDTLLQTAARELGALPNIAEVSVIIGGQDKSNSSGKPEES
jgi:GAF domain-containing protein